MSTLFKSRKFWLMIADVIISTVTYFVAQYAAPEVGEHVVWLIGMWQPVIIFVIVGITVEDAAQKANPNYSGPLR